MNRHHHLYRHLDAEGRLLYVGISLCALNRLSQHKRNSHWFVSIASIKIETFPSRKEAFEAEKLAIKTENPAWNVRMPEYREQFTGKRLTKRGVRTAKLGRHCDGDGLHLVVSKTGRKKWVLRYQVKGVRHDKGLGSYPAVDLKEARDRAREARAQAKRPI